MATVLAGKYRIDGVIGSGAFGTVYQGEHLDIGRAVAIKLLQIPPQLEQRAPAIRARFLREAKILGKLDHPHAVQVLDYGEHAGQPFLVMELLRGRTLHEALRTDGALPTELIYRFASQILAALGRAHDLGLVHRDLKPANVMLVPDLAGHEQVKLLDFGIATAFREDSLADARRLAVTAVGMFVGTPQYAAPEQFVGATTAASDVYAVGLLLWEMITGNPAVGSNVVALCAEAHTGPTEWRLPAHANASPELRRVVERALQKLPERRYADARAMRADMAFIERAPAEKHREPHTMPMAANFEDKPGDLLAGKYRLGRVIGSGGFSRVIRATHVDMEREVAIKVLDLEGAVARSGGTTAGELKTRFGREAKLSSQLRHPNTITVYDFGVDDHGRYYIVMEYVEGTNLFRAIRKEGRFDPRRAATIARDCLRSLAEAHHLGFLHRDLKPGNIMVTTDFAGDEAVKVLDFGIATVVDVGNVNAPQFEALQATRMGSFVGTPQYAAPEQFLGEPLTPATDIYMLGLVLWEMLVGEAAIEADAFGECLRMHLDPSPWSLPPDADVPAGLAQILYGAIAKDPSKRYLSATEMANDLDQWLKGGQRDFRPSPKTEERWEPALDYAPLSKLERAPAQTKVSDSAWRPEPVREEPDDDVGLVPLIGDQDRLTFDPNLDEDFEPELLARPKPAPPEPQRAAPDPTPGRPMAPERGQRGGLASIPKQREVKIELDYNAMAPARPTQAARPAGIDRSGRSEERSAGKPSVDWTKFAGFAGLILVAALVASELTKEPPPPPPNPNADKVKAMDLEEFEKSLREPESAVENRYTTEGIVKALEVGGWSVSPTGSSKALADVHERSYRIKRGGTTMEIRVLTATSISMTQQMFEQTKPPIGAIALDNKLVRIFPPAGKHHPDIDAVIRLLREYRTLVAESAQGTK